jgi:secretion/DNA translocation related TadE-like protein
MRAGARAMRAGARAMWAGARATRAGTSSGLGPDAVRRTPVPDRGSASLWLASVGLVFVAAGVAGSAVGVATVAHHQARNAADLGGLAGAAAVADGPVAACARAAAIAAANRARLVSCAVEGWEIVVRVEVTARPLPGLTRHAAATARAGPVGAAA